MFARGFKTWCEQYALSTRKELGLSQHEKLDPYSLAERLNTKVWNVEEVPGLSAGSQSLLTGRGGSMWSGVTLVRGEKRLIILNSSHSAGRQSNDLMHELSHIALGHSAAALEFSEEGTALRRNYDKQQELEADWLAGCLLLPRPALVKIKRLGLDLAEAAMSYGVSRKMLNYRLAITGVNAQFS